MAGNLFFSDQSQNTEGEATTAQKDGLETLNLRRGYRLSSKETLNHPQLMRHLSGKDPFQETEEAYLVSLERLGIDLVTESPVPWWKALPDMTCPLKSVQ